MERAGLEQVRVDYRNGFYRRDYMTRLGVIRLRISPQRDRGRFCRARSGDCTRVRRK